MEDVNHVKDGKYDDPDDVVVNTPTHFTKLPTLYRQLKEDPCLHYPIWYYPNGNMFSGLGRTLIITRYFREMTLDKVVCNTQDGGSVQDLIDRISESILENKSLTGMNAVVMIANVEALRINSLSVSWSFQIRHLNNSFLDLGWSHTSIWMTFGER